MALTADQRLLVRLYTGWSDRFGQFDSRLEQAMNHADNNPSTLALITNAINGSPPGLLALLQDIDSRLSGSYGRLKADQVGPIALNRGELQQLRSEGRRHVGRLCSILGVQRGHDVFSGSSTSGFAYAGDAAPGGSGGGFVGK